MTSVVLAVAVAVVVVVDQYLCRADDSSFLWVIAVHDPSSKSV